MVHLRFPKGSGLLLVGSGIYWVLSSRLIASPTALAPGLLNDALDVFLLLCFAVFCILTGLPLFIRDVRRLQELFGRPDGWLFTVPIGLAAADLEVTLLGLSTGRVAELNPFVSAATSAGPIVIALFLLSYISLSQGLSVLMLGVGRVLYGSSRALQNLPYSIVCGVAAFGVFSNLALVTIDSPLPWAAYSVGVLGSFLLFYLVYSQLKGTNGNLQTPREK